MGKKKADDRQDDFWLAHGLSLASGPERGRGQHHRTGIRIDALFLKDSGGGNPNAWRRPATWQQPARRMRCCTSSG